MPTSTYPDTTKFRILTAVRMHVLNLVHAHVSARVKLIIRYISILPVQLYKINRGVVAVDSTVQYAYYSTRQRTTGTSTEFVHVLVLARSRSKFRSKFSELLKFTCSTRTMTWANFQKVRVYFCD